MTRITDLLHHEWNLLPGQCSVHSLFRNFLGFQVNSEKPIDAILIQDFINLCLSYPHWQQHAVIFEKELRELFDSFSENHRLAFSNDELYWPSEIQVINLQHHKNWLESVNHYLRSSGIQDFRLVYDPTLLKIISVSREGNKLKVRFFDKLFTIRFGSLEPLHVNHSLIYSSDLELEKNVVHEIPLAAHTFAQLRAETRLFEGSLLRGYQFQLVSQMQTESLEEWPKIFWTLKRIDSLLLRRETDPFYRSLVKDLENLQGQLRWKDRVQPEVALSLIARAQNAIDYAFTDDKLLSLLVKDIQHQLGAKSDQAPESELPPWTKEAPKEIPKNLTPTLEKERVPLSLRKDFQLRDLRFLEPQKNQGEPARSVENRSVDLKDLQLLTK